MPKFFVSVEFTINADNLNHWPAREVALDILRHRIDEGYLLGQISWKITRVSDHPFGKTRPTT